MATWRGTFHEVNHTLGGSAESIAAVKASRGSGTWPRAFTQTMPPYDESALYGIARVTLPSASRNSIRAAPSESTARRSRTLP